MSATLPPAVPAAPADLPGRPHLPGLPCQRHLFDMPREVAWLNAAAYGPQPRVVHDAGTQGVAVKTRPWLHDRSDAGPMSERARAAAAALIGAEPDDIAIVGSISHAIATAAQALPVAPGARILRVDREFPSQSLAWTRLAAERGAVEEIVPRPADGDWTAAVLAAVERPGALPLAVAALTPLHWTDGLRIDLAAIAPAVRRHGAALVIDATQAVGAMPIDARALDADFLAFPTYKWVLGPYSLAFLYAAPRRQTGAPLEENAFNRQLDEPGQPFAPGARRYDMGERTNPVAIPMAVAGLELVAGWTPAAVSARLAGLTDRLASSLQALGLPVAPKHLRVPHILGLRLPGGLPPGLIANLAAAGVHVSDREGALRVSPHAYNDEADIDRLTDALRVALR